VGFGSRPPPSGRGGRRGGRCHDYMWVVGATFGLGSPLPGGRCGSIRFCCCIPAGRAQTALLNSVSDLRGASRGLQWALEDASRKLNALQEHVPMPTASRRGRHLEPLNYEKPPEVIREQCCAQTALHGGATTTKTKCTAAAASCAGPLRWTCRTEHLHVSSEHCLVSCIASAGAIQGTKVRAAKRASSKSDCRRPFG
jgi:hypothetical protein